MLSDSILMDYITPTERDHSARPETEREQEDQDIIETESDLPTQESSRDTGWTPGDYGYQTARGSAA